MGRDWEAWKLHQVPLTENPTGVVMVSKQDTIWCRCPVKIATFLAVGSCFFFCPGRQCPQKCENCDIFKRTVPMFCKELRMPRNDVIPATQVKSKPGSYRAQIWSSGQNNNMIRRLRPEFTWSFTWLVSAVICIQLYPAVWYVLATARITNRLLHRCSASSHGNSFDFVLIALKSNMALSQNRLPPIPWLIID